MYQVLRGYSSSGASHGDPSMRCRSPLGGVEDRYTIRGCSAIHFHNPLYVPRERRADRCRRRPLVGRARWDIPSRVVRPYFVYQDVGSKAGIDNGVSVAFAEVGVHVLRAAEKV